MDERIDIRTATGVDLTLNIAGPGARSYAFFIDWHIRVLLAMALFVVFNYVFVGSLTLLDRDAENFSTYIFVVAVLPSFVYFFYHPVLEVAMRGRTPGKRMAGVRILTEDAQVPAVLALLIRNLLRLVDSLPLAYIIGLVSATITRNSVRIGDIAAGTVLVYESDGSGGGETAAELTAQAVSRYGLEVAELGQELLGRWEQLQRPRRIELATRLLKRIAPEQLPATDDAELAAQLRAALTQPAEMQSR